MKTAAYIAAQGRAINAVQAAIIAGIIRPASLYKCYDCGDDAKCYDHRNYNKPLEVEPVCRSCNIKRGRAKFVIPKGFKCKDVSVITFSVPKHIKKQLIELARKERRSVSQLTSILLESALVLRKGK